MKFLLYLKSLFTWLAHREPEVKAHRPIEMCPGCGRNITTTKDGSRFLRHRCAGLVWSTEFDEPIIQRAAEEREIREFIGEIKDVKLEGVQPK